jgi:peptidoglycan/xylan/chitin deacetylase (PgdA/CDA1 family)
MKALSLFLLVAVAGSFISGCSPAKSPPVSARARSARGTAPFEQGPAMRNPDAHMSRDFSSQRVSYSRVSAPGPYVALTFDDGPHASNTPRLLNILRARNVKATFYVIGKNVDLYPDIVRRTVAEGHELGNHSYTHPVLSKLSQAALFSEIRKTDDAILRAAGVRPRTLRPPYGALTQSQRELVMSTFGYPTIMWSVDPMDWKKPGAGVVTSRIVQGTHAGAIILVHDLHASSVDAMPATIDSLLRRGYRFVTVSQLLAMNQSAQAQVIANPETLVQAGR